MNLGFRELVGKGRTGTADARQRRTGHDNRGHARCQPRNGLPDAGRGRGERAVIPANLVEQLANALARSDGRGPGEDAAQLCQLCQWACMAHLAHLPAEMSSLQTRFAWGGPPAGRLAGHPMQIRPSLSCEDQPEPCNCNSHPARCKPVTVHTRGRKRPGHTATRRRNP
jgi:hypothetical protein